MTISDLPIEQVLPTLLDALARGPNAVLQAPPGAGKTTRVPLALLDQPWLRSRKIVVLEPRRLAARAAAHRMAAMLGRPVGDIVGYRIRMDAKVTARTRIEVVTEGILTRMLQADPALEAVGAVLFDEFHERSLNADLGLALCLESQRALREDLRLLVMSATLDGGPVADLLGGAPIITSEGRTFPVQTHYIAPPSDLAAGQMADRMIGPAVASAVARALREHDGDVLAFLPGGREIRRVEALLKAADAGSGGSGAEPDIVVTPLYGDLPQRAQDRALRPLADGRRKVVLATSIAETSLTIEGIRAVVDSGWARVPRFEPRSGMTRLATVRVSQASADQRRGRAGRSGPGVCYRLWAEAGHGSLPRFATPEILEADLAPLALDLAEWSADGPDALAWLDPPPPAAFAEARELLRRLGALDPAGRITAHGRAMQAMPLHPRLAHMVLKADGLGQVDLACDLAALLSERDILKPGDSDLRLRAEALQAWRAHGRAAVADPAALRRVAAVARQIRDRLGPRSDRRPVDNIGDIGDAGILLAFAYPDRIARRRAAGERSYLLSNGRGAFFRHAEPLSAEDWLVVPELDGERRAARIFAAAPITRDQIETHAAELIETVAFVRWDERERAVLARRRSMLGALVLRDEPLKAPDAASVTAALLAGIRTHGMAILPWTTETARWRARVALLRRLDGDEAWPDLSDGQLLATLEEWLGPYLDGCTRATQLERLDLGRILEARLAWEQRQRLDAQAPTHVTVPSGSRIPIAYGGDGDAPTVAVRLQEMFGCAETPRIAGGRLPLTLHLLSPAHRPVQITQDLGGFWRGSYNSVKADLKGRYPRHYWPDDPLQAQPTARAKPR